MPLRPLLGLPFIRYTLYFISVLGATATATGASPSTLYFISVLGATATATAASLYMIYFILGATATATGASCAVAASRAPLEYNV